MLLSQNQVTLSELQSPPTTHIIILTPKKKKSIPVFLAQFPYFCKDTISGP